MPVEASLPATEPDAMKVVIYATRGDDLLVFDEPDFPDVLLQVPGGTIEPGEDPLGAAIREFNEETGLTPETTPRPLAVHDYRFERDGKTIWHRRHYFHLALTEPQPESWLHYETSPFDGGAAILFRLHWLAVSEAKVKLGYGFADGLHLIGPPRL
jgi:8-oxo-dGTP pyrophosphatase MutT (NUDIX family)